MGRRPSEEQDKFIIRLPDGMREQLRVAAVANNRTMTAEVVDRLRKSFATGEEVRPPTFISSFLLETLEQELEALRGQIRALADTQSTLIGELKNRA